MRDRFGLGNWQDRKESLLKAYDDLERNPLWQELLADCHLHAADLETGAGRLGSDREMNRAHGMAQGVRWIMNRHTEMRDARMAYYEQQQLKEAEELGRQAGTEGAWQEGDSDADTSPRQRQRRRLFPEG